MWRNIRALLRLSGVLWLVVRGLITVLRHFHPNTPLTVRQMHIQVWSTDMLRAFGIRLQAHNTPSSAAPSLLVANHVSWLDILVMNAARPARFVSKADVQHWPVLGKLIVGAGTLLIKRDSRRDAVRVVQVMSQALQEGDAVAVFPEGTTHDGRSLLPFHANLFQAAIDSQTPIQPVALRYCEPNTDILSDAPVFIGEMTLVESVWRTLCADAIDAHVTFSQIIPTQGLARRELSEQAHDQIAQLLGLQNQ